jgi:Flp pilus assembly protein TadG
MTLAASARLCAIPTALGLRCGERLRAESGAVLVEFALVVPLLLTLLFGMLDFGFAMNYWTDETHLANEGARWAAVNRNPSTSGQTLQTFIQQQADTSELRNGGSASVADPLRVCIYLPTNPVTGSSGNVGDPVKVTLQIGYHWLPYLSNSGLADATISSSSVMRLEAAATVFSPSNNPAGC